MIAWIDKQCAQSFMQLLSLLSQGMTKSPSEFYDCFLVTCSEYILSLQFDLVQLLLKLTFPGYAILFHTDNFYK